MDALKMLFNNIRLERRRTIFLSIKNSDIGNMAMDMGWKKHESPRRQPIVVQGGFS